MPSDGPHPRRDIGGIVFSALFVLLGAYALWDTDEMSPLGRVFPFTIASTMIVLALIYIGYALLRPGLPATPEAKAAESTPRRIALVVVMFAWVAAMPWLGFAAAGLGGFLLLAAVAHHDRWTRVRLLTYPLVGLAVVAGFYALFAFALQVPLPRGLLP